MAYCLTADIRFVRTTESEKPKGSRKKRADSQKKSQDSEDSQKRCKKENSKDQKEDKEHKKEDSEVQSQPGGTTIQKARGAFFKAKWDTVEGSRVEKLK